MPPFGISRGEFKSFCLKSRSTINWGRNGLGDRRIFFTEISREPTINSAYNTSKTSKFLETTNNFNSTHILGNFSMKISSWQKIKDGSSISSSLTLRGIIIEVNP